MSLFDNLKDIVPDYWKELLLKIYKNTFKSPSKYIRTISYVSSVFISWSTLRCIFLRLRNKIFNYPPTFSVGFPILGAFGIYPDQLTFNIAIGKYGPIASTRLGETDMIYINDMELIKGDNKVYRDMIDRNSINLWGANDNENQFFFIGGNAWHNRRRIAANAFLNQLNSKVLSSGIRDVLNKQIFPYIDKCNNKLYTTGTYDMQYAVFAQVFLASFGSKLPLPAHSSDAAQTFLKNTTKAGNTFVYGIFNSFFLGIKLANFVNHSILGLLDVFKYTEKTVTDWVEQYEQIMDDNKDDIDEEDNNYYLPLMLKAIKDGKLSRLQMLRDTQSIFLAGVDSTSQSTNQAFFYLAKHPKIQERLYTELKTYKEKHSEFSLQHIHELHVLRAVVYEVLRNIVQVSNSMMKYVGKSGLKIGGYNIPKGWTVIGNHYHINHSEKYWEKPNEFYIEHFLDDKGKFKLNKNFITFGNGKRDCVGQSLALKNMNLLIGHMILRYKILPSDDKLFQSLQNVGLDGFIARRMNFIIQIRSE